MVLGAGCFLKWSLDLISGAGAGSRTLPSVSLTSSGAGDRQGCVAPACCTSDTVRHRPGCICCCCLAAQVIAYNKIDLPDSGDYWEFVKEYLRVSGMCRSTKQAVIHNQQWLTVALGFWLLW